jgi:hypothetical protein
MDLEVIQVALTLLKALGFVTQISPVHAFLLVYD